MIPGTLLGFVALAAALGPGYLYVRRAQRHSNRPAQSQLGELVEMVFIGGGLSLIAAGIVLTAIDVIGPCFVDTSALRKDPAAYIFDEPVRVFTAALAFYGLAYGSALAIAWAAHQGSTAAIEPGVTGWGHAMWASLPDPKKTPVTVTIELKDGRRIAGGLASFTVGAEENREIVLVQPLKATAGIGGEGKPMREDFVVLREDEIAVVSGVYG